MITDTLVGWMLGLITWVSGLTDGLHLDSMLGSLGDITGAWSKLLDLSYFLPIPELFAITLAVMSLGPAALLTTVIVWLLVGVIRGGTATV